MATKVSAQIVLSQSGWTPPGGYTNGSVEGFALNTAISATVLSTAGITGYAWTLVPRIGLTSGSFSPTGLTGAVCTFTPPAVTGWGDLALQLTVYGDPLPDGTVNSDTTTAIVGIRYTTGVYAAGLPIPHWYESSLGGAATIDASKGRERRVHEMALALQAMIAAGGSTVSLNVQSQPVLTGAIVLIAGSGITLSQSGQNITVTASSSAVGSVTIPFGSATGNIDSTFVGPAGSVVDSILVRLTAACDPGATIDVGTPASPASFLATTDVDITNAGGAALPYVKPFVLGQALGANAIRVRRAGASAGGAGSVLVKWTTPAT